LIIAAIITLNLALFGIVKVLSLIIVGPIARSISVLLNSSISGKIKWLTQLIHFFVAFGLTLIVQSSNIITATLVPLCGIGIISLQRVYVMTLGSNIGTTITGILTAFTQPSSTLIRSLQLAFVYTLFNSFGVLLWLPLPFMRFPKRIARKLGNTVFEYRWFLYVYVGTVYFVIPLIIFGISLIPYWIGLAIVGIPFIILILGLIVIKILRSKFPKVLPERFKNFDWLPLWMRSLKPYDKKMQKIKCLNKKDKGKGKKKTSSDNLTDLNNKEATTNKEEEEDEVKSIDVIPNVIRKMSVMNGLVHEARRYSVQSQERANSSSEDEHDTEPIKEYRRRKSLFQTKISDKEEEIKEEENESKV
jgi:sodium-dependent phosphate cotransporter